MSNKVVPLVDTEVLPTTTGFRKVITKVTPGERKMQPEEIHSDLWSKGQTYGRKSLCVCVCVCVLDECVCLCSWCECV